MSGRRNGLGGFGACARHCEGRGLVPRSSDLAHARGTQAGRRASEPDLTCPVYASAAEALADPCDVFVEYTKPDVAKPNILNALGRCTCGRRHVGADRTGLHRDRRRRPRAGSWRARLRQFCPHRRAPAEVRGSGRQIHPAVGDLRLRTRQQVDAPSGTVRELANRLAKVRQPELTESRWRKPSGRRRRAAPPCPARRFTRCDSRVT